MPVGLKNLPRPHNFDVPQQFESALHLLGSAPTIPCCWAHAGFYLLYHSRVSAAFHGHCITLHPYDHGIFKADLTVSAGYLAAKCHTTKVQNRLAATITKISGKDHQLPVHVRDKLSR